jgi:hypothetical protein
MLRLLLSEYNRELPEGIWVGHSVGFLKKRTVDRADSVPKGLRNTNPYANNDDFSTGKLL